MIIALFLVIVIAVLFYNYRWKRQGLPPGPAPVPILGNAYELKRHECVDDAFQEWRKQYGDVFTFWLGEDPVVAVCDYKLIINYFVRNGELFQDRPNYKKYLKYVGRGEHGVLNTDGELWKTQRRFALHTLRNFGLGKDIMEERILEECEGMLESIEKHRRTGNDFIHLNNYIDTAVGSVINNVLFGYRYNESNINEFTDLKERTKASAKASGNPLMFLIKSNVDLFAKIPVLNNLIDQAKARSVHLTNFFKDRIRDHVEDLKDEDWNSYEPTDFVASFLKEKHRLDQSGEEHYFTDQQLVILCFDLWSAGQETTATTLGWGIAFLILNPRIQKKAHDELDREVGSDRMVTSADRPNLPYIQAICNEVQRLGNILPSNLIHATTEDVVVEGYHLKKGTRITPLISLVLFDEKIFPEPKKFMPERFLDDEGRLKKVEELIPFSIGKRQCLGEGLAKMELFLFMANILNKYKILSAEKKPTLKRGHGITLAIPQFECQLEPRF